MSEPTAANDHEQHTTTIEITGNGQINAAFENTEGPEGAQTPQTPPPPPTHIQRPSTPPPQVPRPNTPPPQIPTPQHETTHMNGETPHMNGEAKTNGVELRTPGTEDNKEVNEAVNLELVNMQPYSNSIPIKKESTELDIGDPYDEYFVPVNQHKKYMRGEKLYVTQDKRRSLGGSKKKCCWGVLTVIVLGGIVAILIGVILSSQDNAPVEESRNFNGMKASIGGGLIPTPSPSSTPPPSRPTTDMSEIYLNNVLQGELTIDNLEFTPGLADKNSSEFRNLAASLEEELKSALFDHQTLHYGSADITVKVLEFRPGSVVVVYRVGWEFKDGIKNPPDPIDKDGLKTRLQDHLRSHDGFLYNYRLTLHNLKSERVSNACKIENGGCSQNCIFDTSNLMIVCTCEEHYVLSSDGKTCVNSEKGESGSSSEEASIDTSKNEHGGEHESSSEVNKTSEDQNNDNTETDEVELPDVTEHFPEHEYHAETKLPPENENFGMKETSVETYVTPVPIQEQDKVTQNTSEPVPEQNTQQILESTDYQPTVEPQYKKAIESDKEPVIEPNNSAETAPSDSNDFVGEQTEAIPHMKSTDVSMDFDSSSEPKFVSESPTYQGPVNLSDSSMDSVHSTLLHQDVSFETTPETTPMPPFNLNSEENSDLHHLTESTEVPVEQTNPSSSSPATSSERLAKYNQFPLGESEDSLYAQTTVKDLMLETTALPTESIGEPNTMSDSSEFNNHQSSENSHFYHSSPPTTISYTEQHDEISTGKIYSDNSEINPNGFFHQMNNENLMTTPSPSYTDPKEDENSAEVEQTTKKSFSIWETGDQSANISGDTGYIGLTDHVEDINITETMTTMMPWVQSEEVNQNNTYMIPDSMSIFNSSQSLEVSSPESKTEFSTDKLTTLTAQNINELGSSPGMSNAEEETMPTEPINNHLATISDTNMNTSSPSSTDIMTMTTLSSPSSEESATMTPGSSSPSAEAEFTNLNNSSQTLTNTETFKELNMVSTETPIITDTLITSGLNGTISDMNLEAETNQPTTEPASSSVEQSDNTGIYEEPKIPNSVNSDSVVPTFLVGGENMPPIALTTNPDLSGPYSVDSTIQPVPEEEDVEEIKLADSFNSGGSSDTEVHHDWYDSKNGLNNLDDDYNEEEKYASYKLTKGKSEHVTKGYKSIKLEEKSRFPEDSDAVEQTQSQRIEQVPITTSESSNTTNLLTTETNESVTTFPPSEGLPSKIREEEQLLIKEVYTDTKSVTSRPNIEFELSTEPQSGNQDFNEMRFAGSTEISMNPNVPTSNHSMDTVDDSVLKEMNYTSAQNFSHPETEEKNNDYAVTETMRAAEVNPTTSSSLLSSVGSTLDESVPRTTMFYESNNPSNNKTECDSEHFACHDGSKCLMKLQQCDGMQDCVDGSDEEGCEKLNCVDNFKCNDGRCLSKHFVCNGIQNCPDGNDEENCDSEKKEHIMEQPNATEPNGTESPAGKIELGSTDSFEHLLIGSTNFPERLTEPDNSRTEISKDEETGSEITTMEPVIKSTEPPLSSIEPVINGKEQHVSSTETVAGETAAPGISMETVMSSKVSEHIEQHVSSTEKVAGETAAPGISMETVMSSKVPEHIEQSVSSTASMSSMELVNMGTETPLSFSETKMTTHKTPIASTEAINGSINTEPPPSSMQVFASDNETSLSVLESVSNATELPISSIETNMRTNEPPIISKEPEISITEKPLGLEAVVGGRKVSFKSMDLENGGIEEQVSSMESNVSGTETPLTMVPVVQNTEESLGNVSSDLVYSSSPATAEVLPNSGNVSSDSVYTSSPATGEESLSSDEMISINSTGSMMSSTTELPSKSSEQLVSSSTEPEHHSTTVNPTVPPSSNITESQANGDSETTPSQTVISSTETSSASMESSTSHSKITESAPVSTDHMSSSVEPSSTTTEATSDSMEPFPFKTAFS